jgi:type II secretory ATPase GspE/PulE/Tfp pilus assembly ATPase PilB-like protein
MHTGIVSRIKVMANLNIAEHRLPQDGRIKFSVGKKEVDFRVSVIPSYYGEKVCLRVLDRTQVMLEIERLGFEEEPLSALQKAAFRPHGMVLITGPTGSGKTTTMYALLKKVDSPEKNLVTVEDPVEYRLPLIRQTQINLKAGVTFATGLRSLLRQDPDIIMVGEIRDRETAEIAIHAALTGHVVLSTLHTNDAVGAVARLLDMNIESYLLASTLTDLGVDVAVAKITTEGDQVVDVFYVKDAFGLQVTHPKLLQQARAALLAVLADPASTRAAAEPVAAAQ